MRICRITKHMPSLTANPGGLHAYFFTRYMPDPTLIIAKADGHEWLPLPAHAEVAPIAYRDVPFKERMRDGGNRVVRAARIAGLLVLKTRELAFTVKSLRPLARFRPDVVHTHGIVTLVPGIVAKATLRCRLVVTIHSTTDAEYARRSRLVRRTLRYADRIICVSGAVREVLRPALPEARIDVIPSAVDLDCFSPGPFAGPGASAGPELSARRPQLIAVGYFKPQKRYEDLVEAAALVLERFPDHRLVIAGDGPERPRIAAMIADRGLLDRIVLLGAVSQAELARHLRESRLFLMTSVSEGLPKAILEALACGTPIVVTTACNVNDIVGDVGVAVAPLEPARFAAEAIALLEDGGRWSRCAANAVAVAARYDWKAVAGQVRAVYEDALAA